MAETLYVREDTSHGGTRNGLTYATAWGGWGEIQWGDGAGKVSAGDTLMVCGSHAYTSAIAIGVSGTSAINNVTIDGSYATDVGSITFTGAYYIACPRDYISFDNITINGDTSSCVYIYGADRIGLYFNNTIIDGGTTGILLPQNYNVTDVKIDGCIFQNQSGNASIRWLSATPATDTKTISDVDITDTTFQSVAGNAIEIRIESDCPDARTDDIYINNCTFTNISAYAIVLGGGTITAGVNNHNSGYMKVTNCDFDTVGNAIACVGCNATEYGHNIFSDNTIANNSLANGPINILNGKYIEVYDNYIHDSTTTTIDGNGVLIDYGNEYAKVYRNRIDNMLGKAGVNNSGCAVMVLNASNVYVYNNYGIGNRHGIFQGDVSASAGASVGNVYYYNNTFVGNTITGIYIETSLDATDVSKITFKNNILTASAVGKGIDDNSTGGGEPIHTNNCLYNFATPYEGISAGADEITTNPLFRSATDYHLQKTSPCIDAGANLPEVTDDYYSTPRPLVGTTDIGATEYYKAKIKNATIR